ncbi:cyanophycin synthetase [Aureisphaera galaxeae]|uniref:UDP-N-acetylmuramate--L-alanine ligase n=1 Tax=Aureisphaera galaxeae TaxID=1538023 RepID=UPI00235066E0|nr:Mur ligase domain-containing protein [Aureisphaera galaxeae]MDC8003206.1 cyanophycin synthetase [Aureisphaera galaxeae]
MKDLKDIQHIYFVGIGGIGMSALARYALRLGKTVWGYDKTATKLTDELIAEGMQITFTDATSEIDAEQLQLDDTLVVFTPAIPKSNQILRYFQEQDYAIMKRAKFLGEVTKDTLCLAVAGTHGKTTTSAILGHLLAECDMPVTAFLGGIAENYHSNFISKGTEITVVEADEFDRSFLQLSPDIACVTSMDADHLDIYGDSSSIEASFKEFAGLLSEKQNLLFKKGLPLEGKSVAINETADFEAQNVRIENGSYVFDLKTPNEVIENLTFLLPGHHNLHNAITALGMAIFAGTPTSCLPKALFSFKGVERRFTYKIRSEEMVLIDDYAHHPTEIDALHQAVSEMYPGERTLIAFQPHLFSRTQDFADGFAESLGRFDEVFLLEIYPAREEPILGVTSEWLCDKMEGKNAQVISKEALPGYVKNSACKVRLLVGAGDIGAEVEKVTKYIQDEG